MSKVLSIVVPSYNTEKFIRKNIPCFFDHQINNKIEIILIDDGSKDKTLSLLKEFESLHPECVVVISKKNGGHGSVINTGIEVATGKYFKVVDGDDWVTIGNLIKLVNKLEKIEADLVINYYNVVLEGKEKRQYLIDFGNAPPNEVIDFDVVAKYYQKIPIHSITFKTSILKDNHVKVREKCFYEDNEFDLFPIPHIQTCLLLNYPVYNYLMAQRNQSVSKENIIKNNHMFRQVIDDCIDFYDGLSFDISDSKRDYIIRTIDEIVRSEYNVCLRVGSKQAYNIIQKFNATLRKKSPFFFDSVSTKYKYIALLQRKNILCFYFLSIAIRLYKYFHKRQI